MPRVNDWHRDESRLLCSLPDLESFQKSVSKFNIGSRNMYICCVVLRKLFSLSLHKRIFKIMLCCWILSNAFYASINQIYKFFLLFILLIYEVNQFLTVEASLYFWNKPNLVLMYYAFYMLWILASVFIGKISMGLSF